MDTKKTNFKIGVLIMMVVVAAASRLMPHPDNFTPIGAMALFGAAYFPKKWMAVIVPFLALWASSMILDNVFFAQYYDSFQWFSQPFVFLAFGLTIGLGWLMLKKVKPGNLIAASLISSAIFFLVTNFGHWVMFSPDKTWVSLTAVYAAGVPFIRGTVMGDLVYVTILFGAYEWMKRSVPALKTEQA